jgi:DNA-binding LacI/PurR family transcriptional regulator
MGFDDFVMGADGYSWAAMFSPQLTTVAQPSYEIGREALRLLLVRIEECEDAYHDSQETVVRLPVELRVRESTVSPLLS